MYKISSKLIPSEMKKGERERISKSIHSHCPPDSLITYILALQSKESFPTDDNKIHSAFFTLQKQYPDVFNEFVFSKGDLYPFSKELEGVLFRLQQSGILSTMNPGFERYVLPIESKEIILEFLSEKFSGGEKKKLEKIAKIFESLITS